MSTKLLQSVADSNNSVTSEKIDEPTKEVQEEKPIIKKKKRERKTKL